MSSGVLEEKATHAALVLLIIVKITAWDTKPHLKIKSQHGIPNFNLR